jgi:hypothetical protein
VTEPPAYPPPDEAQSPRWRNDRALTAVTVVTAAVLGAGLLWHYVTSDTAPSAQLHEVTYQVGGSATGADITIETPSGQSQHQGVAVPMTTSNGTAGLIFHMQSGAFVYIAAQNTGDGTISCSISVDGVVTLTNTSSGEFAIATCSGTV